MGRLFRIHIARLSLCGLLVIFSGCLNYGAKNAGVKDENEVYEPFSRYSIVSGEFKTNHTEFSVSKVTYSLTDIICGSCRTGEVGLIYFTKTRTGEFPAKALLLVDTSNPGFLRLAGNDATRSVWVYSDANRRFLVNRPIKNLMLSLRGKSLSKDDAERIVRRDLNHDPDEIVTRRYEYGWIVTVIMQSGALGAWADYWVRDDGEIVRRSGGM